jgi:hypothetical protein
VPTATNTAIGDPVCAQIVAGAISQSGAALSFDLTNNSGGDVSIDAMQIVWNVGNATKILDVNLDGLQIGSPNDSNSPTDFPSPNPFTGIASRRIIENDGSLTEVFEVVFENNPTGGGYSIQLHFDSNCQITVSN